MDSSGGDTELTGRMQRIDEITESPNKRATRLWTHLSEAITELPDDIPDYDLLCLSIEITAMLANGNYPWALEGAKKLSKDLYLFHYYVFGEEEYQNAQGDPTPLSDIPNSNDDGALRRRKSDIQLTKDNREGEDSQHSKDERPSSEDAGHSLRSGDEAT